MSFVGTTPTADPQPTIYFELSWAILSSIGLMNVFYGGLVVGITSLSPITIVPIVVSAACAIANGMCYYSSYANYQQIPSLVAGIIADFMWLVSDVTYTLDNQLPKLDIKTDTPHRSKRLACHSTATRFSAAF
jgi:hypothetical protein